MLCHEADRLDFFIDGKAVVHMLFGREELPSTAVSSARAVICRAGRS